MNTCINCSVGIHDKFPRDEHEEHYCHVCIMRGYAVIQQPEKVFLVWYSGWDEYHHALLSIHTTKEKADAYISKSLLEIKGNYRSEIDCYSIEEMELL